MEHHDNSSELNKKYLCKYTDIKELKEKQVTGYKLVLDLTENYYSVGTGFYRYKVGNVKRRENDYSKLYENTDYFQPEFADKTAIFTDINDINEFYPDWEGDTRVCIIKVVMGGNLISAVAENNYHKCNVYAGSIIKSIKRHELQRD
jgi:hypothetical protein